jgi:hypothetical protein
MGRRMQAEKTDAPGALPDGREPFPNRHFRGAAAKQPFPSDGSGLPASLQTERARSESPSPPAVLVARSRAPPPAGPRNAGTEANPRNSSLDACFIIC